MLKFGDVEIRTISNGWFVEHRTSTANNETDIVFFDNIDDAIALAKQIVSYKDA